MSTFYEKRFSYPFYTESGAYDKFTEAITDMALWVDAGAILPIQVLNCEPTGSGIRITLMDDSYMYTYTMDSTSGYIYTADDVLSGLVHWNQDIVQDLKATLESMTPTPQEKVYVLPTVCSPRHAMPLSVIYINGAKHKYSASISVTDINHIKVDNQPQGTSFNLYQYDPNLDDSVISDLVISTDIEDYVLSGFNGNIWLRSDAESDIRVVTTGCITIQAIVEG